MKYNNMETKTYVLGNYTVVYLINVNQNVSMLLYPSAMEKKLQTNWEKEPSVFDPRADYMNRWIQGSLAYFSLEQEQIERPGVTMKGPALAERMKFREQYTECHGNSESIVTMLESEEGYQIRHCLTYYEGRKGLECETSFVNRTGEDVVLQMLSSVALDNLSPFQNTDAPDTYYFHRFYGGWSLEGKHVGSSIEELALEKTWAGFTCNSEKFGSVGSWPVERYFPMAVFEDREQGMFWAMQLVHNTHHKTEVPAGSEYRPDLLDQNLPLPPWLPADSLPHRSDFPASNGYPFCNNPPKPNALSDQCRSYTRFSPA